MLDYKARDWKGAKKPPLYESEVLQLAAYQDGYWEDHQEQPIVGNIILNVDLDGRTEDTCWDLLIHSSRDTKAALDAFHHLFNFWKWAKKYDPSQPTE